MGTKGNMAMDRSHRTEYEETGKKNWIRGKIMDAILLETVEMQERDEISTNRSACKAGWYPLLFSSSEMFEQGFSSSEVLAQDQEKRCIRVKGAVDHRDQPQIWPR